jgi:DNA polymerase III epsilon subunit-like protein
MSFIVVDVEADGPYPGDYSMVSFGAVVVEPSLSKTFYGEVAPISEKWNPQALAVSNITREKHLTFEVPEIVMPKFAEWIKLNSKKKPILISDNNGFDAAFMNYYFHKFYGSNPFGWSSRRIGDLFCGAEKNLWYQWKKHRITSHTHVPIDDAKGNAEALLYFSSKYNISLP